MENSTGLKLSEFDYFLPKELIAQYPSRKRDDSKLLVLHRNSGKIEHKIFRDIIDYFSENDVLIVNKTKVIPARLKGYKSTGGKIEVLILTYNNSEIISALVKPLKNVKIGTCIFFGTDFCEIVGIENEIVKLKFSNNIDIILEKYGKIPLPPYIKRDANLLDTERYQTIFASHNGSIAAPTAGLHFTEQILEKLKNKNVKIVEILLHISWSTFSPVRCENIAEYKMAPEYFEVSNSAANAINSAKRKIAVGTTTVRVLESVSEDKKAKPQKGITNIFIYPGYKFKNVDALITNFHLPKTTLFMLVCAFAGRDLVFKAYEAAKKENYRFASYGDAMLIL